MSHDSARGGRINYSALSSTLPKVQRQTAVASYFSSKQLLLCACALQNYPVLWEYRQ